MANLTDASLSKSIEGISDPLDKLRRMVRSEFHLMHRGQMQFYCCTKKLTF